MKKQIKIATCIKQSISLSITLLIAILLIVTVIPIHVHGEQDKYDINSPEVKSITSQLSMEGHSEHDLSTCATKIRYYEEVVELLEEGKSEQEILDYYVGMYGEEGLKEPNKSGFSLLAWTIPFIAIAIVGIVLYVKLGKKIKTTHSNDEEDIDFDADDEALATLIDEERRKYY